MYQSNADRDLWQRRLAGQLCRRTLDQLLCLQQCQERYLVPQDGVLSLDSAYRYVRLPEGLHSQPAFALLVRRARSRLQAEFDDLDAVWGRDSLRKAFLDMPLTALLVRLLPQGQPSRAARGSARGSAYNSQYDCLTMWSDLFFVRLLLLTHAYHQLVWEREGRSQSG